MDRLGFLQSVGLEYLTLSRSSGTLSGGESQRIRLATQIGSSLMGVLYILDEPSIGLHQRDNDKLLATLGRLRDLGNTLIVVEHDEDTMFAADHIVDIGPGAGTQRRRGRVRGHDRRAAQKRQIHHRTVPFGQKMHSGARNPAQRQRQEHHGQGLCGRTTSNTWTFTIPLGTLHLRDRCVRFGQILVGQRDPVQKAGRGAESARRPVPGEHDAIRAASRIWIRSSTLTSRPSGARRAPIRRPTPVCSTTSAICSPRRRMPRRAATGPSRFSLQCQGRPLRSLLRATAC